MANTIRSLRQEKGWSISELARRARIHPSDMSRIEAGRATPYKPQVTRLARALKINSEDLLAMLGPTEPAVSQ